MSQENINLSDYDEYANLGGPDGIDNINYQIEQVESHYDEDDCFVEE